MLLDQFKNIRALMRRGRAKTAQAPEIALDGASGDLDGAVAGTRLIVAFSDACWDLRLVDRGIGATVESRQGVLVDGPSLETATGNSVSGLRAALRTLAPGERAVIESVELYPIEPEIEIFDNRAIRAFSAEASALRPIAENLTGVPDCAFDSALFGAASDDRRLVAVCRIELLRQYLATLGDLAPRLRVIAPEPIQRLAASDAATPQAVLYIGAQSSMFYAADPASGVFAARTTATGVAAFAKLVADANSLPLAEAAQEMAKRDMTARAVAAGLTGPLDALEALIRDTLAYVSNSRLADAPHRIELAGATGAISGLPTLLAEHLNIEVVTPKSTATLPDDLVAPSLNLLRSAEGTIFAEGTREYVFEADRFVGRETTSRKEAAPKSRASKATPPRKVAGIEIGGFSGELTPKRLAALAAGGAALTAFAFYDLAVAPAASALAFGTGRYQGEQTSAQALTAQVLTLRSAARQDALAAAGANKILWAEKFVSIGAALPTGLWLKEAAIQSDIRRVGKVEVVATKLALIGVARSTGQRRLQEIAAFIQALEADAAFMQDFRAITFAGLGGEGATAAFEIHAWYDENKRREGADDSAESSNPLQAVTAAAAARRRATPDPARGLQR